MFPLRESFIIPEQYMKRKVREGEEKRQGSEIHPGDHQDRLYNAVSGDSMFPAIVTRGSFTRL